MKGLNALELQGFYSPLKSIAPNFKFTVTIYDNSMWKGGHNSYARDLYNRIGPMPIIANWNVLNVTVPSYDFKKEVQYYGSLPRSFPILEYDGLEVNIEFEEDAAGTIAFFINWLQKRVIDKQGLYTPPAYVALDKIVVQTEDSYGIPIAFYMFNRCYFLNASPVNLDYSDNASIKYNVVFNADYVNTYFPKKAPVAAAQKLGTDLIGQSVEHAGQDAKNISKFGVKNSSLLRMHPLGV